MFIYQALECLHVMYKCVNNNIFLEFSCHNNTIRNNKFLEKKEGGLQYGGHLSRSSQ